MPSQDPKDPVSSTTQWRQNNPEKARILRQRELVQITAKRRAKREEAERQRAAQEPASEKQCSQCGVTKPFAAFNKKARSKDGYRPECRDCQHQDYEVYKPIQQTRNQQNKEQNSLRNAQYHQEHRETILARHVRNRLKNPEKHIAYMATYRLEHPEYFREAAKRRRAQEAGAQITDLSQQQFDEILERSNYRCCYCPDDCKECRRKTHTFQKEHLTPIVKGGNHTVQNVLPACAKCNGKKYAGNVLKPVQPFLLTVSLPHQPKRKKKGA